MAINHEILKAQVAKIIHDELPCGPTPEQLMKNMFKSGEDPGGWSHKTKGCYLVMYTENSLGDMDWSWWLKINKKISAFIGRQVFFEPFNSAVTALYEA